MKIYEYWKCRPKLHSSDAADYLFAVIAEDGLQADRIFQKMENEEFDNSFYIKRERNDMCGMVVSPVANFGCLS